MPEKGPKPLSSIFDGKSASETKPVSSEKEPDKKVEEKKEEPKKSEDKKVADKPTPDPKSKTEDKEQKAIPETDKSKDTPPKKEDKKDDGKSEDDKKKETPSVDWEAEDNPYKKRQKDTATNWNKEHQENLQLKDTLTRLTREVEVLKKKEDGTYDPEKDGPKQVTSEDIATAALNTGKMLASRNAAYKEHGKEKVEAEIAEFNSLFGENELVQAVVLGSESPIAEAFSVLERYRFESKYGSKPSDVFEAVKKEVLAEAEVEMKKRITQEIMDGLDRKNNTPRGLSSSRGSNGLDDGGKPSQPTGAKPLKKIFG